jgi:hypothetical protein
MPNQGWSGSDIYVLVYMGLASMILFLLMINFCKGTHCL